MVDGAGGGREFGAGAGRAGEERGLTHLEEDAGKHHVCAERCVRVCVGCGGYAAARGLDHQRNHVQRYEDFEVWCREQYISSSGRRTLVLRTRFWLQAAVLESEDMDHESEDCVEGRCEEYRCYDGGRDSR